MVNKSLDYIKNYYLIVCLKCRKNTESKNQKL